jgi:hypothetical protein
MFLNKNIRVCTHVKVNGRPCGSPALHDEAFCYFHQRMFRGVATPPKSRVHSFALIENAEAIQVSIMEVLNALARNTIDFPRAQLILRALHIAVKNARNVRFDICQDDMVRAVPDFPAPPAPPARPEPSPAILASSVIAAEYLEQVQAKLAAALPARRPASRKSK